MPKFPLTTLQVYNCIYYQKLLAESKALSDLMAQMAEALVHP